MGINWPEQRAMKNFVYYRNDREQDIYSHGYNKALDDCKKAYAQREEAKENALVRLDEKQLMEIFDYYYATCNDGKCILCSVCSERVIKTITQKFGATKALSVKEIEKIITEHMNQDGDGPGSWQMESWQNPNSIASAIKAKMDGER